MTNITDEQRAAVEWLHEVKAKTNGRNVRNHVHLLLDALPSELTNPQPVLPEAPGHYEDEEGRHWLHQVYRGDGDRPLVDQWLGWRGTVGVPDGPVYRLERARPHITREQVIGVLNELSAYSTGAQADAILALENGPDRD